MPRPAHSLPHFMLDGWTMKPYRVLGRCVPETETLAPNSIETIRGALPRPALAPNRPGVAFVIEHFAFPLDYLVLCWWENQNEMNTRIFIRSGAEAWRLTSGAESFCVWDLDIMWFERNAFVKHMLAGVPDPAAYAAARFDKAFAG